MPRTLPILDLSSWREGDRAALARIGAVVGAACRDVGFFYVVNHGVDRELIERAFAQSRRFFALPLAERQALAIETIGGNRGYSGMLHEALDPGRGPDMKEAFNVGLEIAPDDPDLLSKQPFRSLNAWPSLPNFRETLLAYYDACAALGARLHRAFACDLGLKPDFFDDKFDRPMATLRLLHYPAPPQGSEPRTGAGVHTDYGNLTLLATDDVGGLEVRARNGEWIEAPVIPGAFIVNIGDCLMRWTNDIYVSTPHRVVNRSARERYSIAFFYDPNPDAAVETIPSCVRQGDRVRYAPIGRRLSETASGREQAGGGDSAVMSVRVRVRARTCNRSRSGLIVRRSQARHEGRSRDDKRGRGEQNEEFNASQPHYIRGGRGHGLDAPACRGGNRADLAQDPERGLYFRRLRRERRPDLPGQAIPAVDRRHQRRRDDRRFRHGLGRHRFAFAHPG